VVYWMQQENIALNQLLVVTDDLNLPFGTIRIKAKGSDGGHNGLKDIQARLETNQYARFRFGIGDEFSKGQQIDYVLGNWSVEESDKLKERLERSAEAIKTFAFNGLETAMNSFNNT
jgi:peptidyl-tRNA hydrolase, PTH1 family